MGEGWYAVPSPVGRNAEGTVPTGQNISRKRGGDACPSALASKFESSVESPNAPLSEARKARRRRHRPYRPKHQQKTWRRRVSLGAGLQVREQRRKPERPTQRSQESATPKAPSLPAKTSAENVEATRVPRRWPPSSRAASKARTPHSAKPGKRDAENDRTPC